VRPTTIPDDEIMEGHRRIVMGPPLGHDVTGDIRAVEMLAGPEGVFRARIALEEGDLERLAAGEPFWVSFWGGVIPFDVSMTEAAA
jgi:hypothetical protein